MKKDFSIMNTELLILELYKYVFYIAMSLLPLAIDIIAEVYFNNGKMPWYLYFILLSAVFFNARKAEYVMDEIHLKCIEDIP